MTEKAYKNFIPEVWAQKINTALEKNCVMLQCVNRDFQGDADKGGEKINIITPGDVTANAYTGTIGAYETPSSAKGVLNLDQETYFAFSIPDVSAVQSSVSLMDAYTEKAKKAIEQRIDTYLFGKHADVAASNAIAKFALSAENIYAKFVELAKKLKLSNALGGEITPWVVIHPDVEEILLNSSAFTTASNAGDTLKREGAIGRIAGLEVLVSTNVGKVADDYTILAGTNRAITYASQINKIESIRDTDSFSDLVRGLYVYGALTVNPGSLASMTATIGA